MRTNRPAVLVSILFLAVACGTDDPLASPDEVDGSWQLVSGMSDGSPIEPVTSHPVTLEIDGDEAGGTAACNGYGGEVEIGGGSVAFTNMAITEMACSPTAVMELEQAYMSALLAVDTVRVEGETLILEGEGIEFVFEMLAPPPTAEMLGTVWVLDGLVSGDAVSSVAGERATLELFTDGSFLASTGCRSVFGSYTESAGSIQTTEMQAEGECPEDLQAQDGMVITVLEGPFRAEVDGQSLIISIAGDEGLTYRAEG